VDPRRAPIEEDDEFWQESAEEEVGALTLQPTGTTGGATEPRGVIAGRRRAVRIYPFGISRERLEQAAREMQAPVEISPDQRSADAVIALKTYYRRQSGRLEEGERKPIYILRTNTVAQMQQCLARIFDIQPSEATFTTAAVDERSPMRLERTPQTARIGERQHPTAEAIKETEDAIIHLLNSGQRQVELPPAIAPVRRLQHKLADRYNLESRSFGKDPYRRVKIFAR
jgi:hypothetical protein